MSPPSYITRRADRGGVYGVQIRITLFGGERTLLRYSLATRDHRQAIGRASAYLAWLFLMMNPAEMNAQIDQIITTARDFIAAGPAADDFTAQHRRHFLIVATRMLDAWHANDPCPVKFANLYARQTEFAGALSELSACVRHDFEALSIAAPDPHYARKPRQPTFHYLCGYDGRIEEIVDRGLPSHYPTIADELCDPGEAPRPAYNIGDMFGEAPPPSATHREALAPSGPRADASLSVVSRGPEAEGAGASVAPLMSKLLTVFLDELAQEAGGARIADKDIRPYVELLIFVAGDRPIADYKRQHVRLFCEACSDVPHQAGMRAQTPIERLQHVRAHGWQGLRRMSTTTIQNRYFTAIRRLFRWAMAAEHFAGVMPELTVMGRQVNHALVKDAFTDTELERLFGAPMFTGHQPRNKSAAGPWLDADAMYWGYLVSILTGMRPGEIAQLEIADLKEIDEISYFDIRPFDPEKGRVALADLRTLKTGNAARFVPIHKVLIELGLGERAACLRKLGHRRLFPEWAFRRLVDGDLKHGDALTRHWQKRKAAVTTRANVSLYSGRHTMADLLDRLNVPARDRDRILGHAHAGIGGRYGCKGPLPTKLALTLVEADIPVVQFIRQRLIPARQRAVADRKLLSPWATRPARDGT